MPKPRTPTAVKAAKGTMQPCRVNPAEPKPRRALLQPPEDFEPVAAAQWRYIAPILDRMQVLTEADEWALAEMCLCRAEMLALRGALPADGTRSYEEVTARGGRVLRPYPEVAQLADCERRFLEYLRRFGLTPADRSRVSAQPAEKDAAAPWAFLAKLPGEAEGAAAN